MQEVELGLRERKRLEARARMERAAVEIVLRDGLNNTTVDAISEAANVSSRTFFNYFDSKEDAILGLQDIPINDELVLSHARANDGSDVVTALVGVLMDLVAPTLADSTLRESRTAIIKLHPELLSRQVAQMTRLTDELTLGVRLLMTHDPRFSDTAPQSPIAELILALCASSVRAAVREWIAAGSREATADIKTRAIALAREVVEKFQ